jgi:DNA helicase-2/ATP-dependent DNA helicase PcrA
MALIDVLRPAKPEPADLLAQIIARYRPKMETLYPDDWPRRLPGLEELTSIAAGYDDLDLLIADLSLESPEERAREEDRQSVTLSTIHSAKGLEWSAVLILDLVEERFPSRHALARPDDFEEERRLMYVACTRAKDNLDLFVPLSLFSRGTGGQEPAVPSPFVRALPLADLEEIHESYDGLLARQKPAPSRAAPSAFPAAHSPDDPPDNSPDNPFDNPPDNPSDPSDPDAAAGTARPDPGSLGFCRHRIFGRGKIVESLPPDKYRVNFPGIGLKVILAAYLSPE